VEVFRDALEICGVVEFVRTSEAKGIDESRFIELHRDWCCSVVAYLAQKKVANPTFGRAAKLVAVYLKSMIVLGPAGDTDLARVAHPPIDGILLQNISKAQNVQSAHRREWRNVSWTQLGEDPYYCLIRQLRSAIPPGEPLWNLERFWTVTNESER
jgi:hypothetical protein